MVMKPEIWQTLIGAGLCPPGSELSGSVASYPDSVDLLPAVIGDWQASADSGTAAGGSPVAQRLAALHATGACLTLGWPGSVRQRFNRRLGVRWAWWPRGLPAGRTVGIVSSRLGRELDLHRLWFAVLRTACMKLAPERDLLVTARSTATQRFIHRCADLFGLRILSIDVDRDDGRSLQRWGRQVLKPASEAGNGNDWPVVLSPQLESPASSEASPAISRSPIPDAAVTAICDRLIALRVRDGGNLVQLLESRLSDPEFPVASVFLALGEDLNQRSLADRLLSRGAVGWYVAESAGSRRAEAPFVQRQHTEEDCPSAPVLEAVPEGTWPYLTHCTRRRRGPWPDESEEEFLDSLILDRAGADHSAIAALWRIVSTRRLIAASEVVRGDIPVVSLTAVPLGELPELRAFRSHLGRWDFEPYGICIRREWLEARGVRPVRYGDEALWRTLEPRERPYFQKAASVSSTGRHLDWTVEQEWRHAGDLDLQPLSADDAFLFAPTREDACRLALISRWPIVLAPAAGSR